MWGYQTLAPNKHVEDSPNSVRLGRDYLCSWPMADGGMHGETCLKQLQFYQLGTLGDATVSKIRTLANWNYLFVFIILVYLFIYISP